MVKRRIAHEAAPYNFMAQWRDAEAAERNRILRSRELSEQVKASAPILDLITVICAEYQVDGLQADV